jgi:hypothetical protein
MLVERSDVKPFSVLDDFPGRVQRGELLVDSIPPGLPLKLFNHGCPCL